MSPRLASVSRISCCWAGSADGGLRKTISTPSSPAALLQPASTIDQKGSGLLLTKATFGLVPDETPAPDGLGALQAAIATSIELERRNKRLRVILAPGVGVLEDVGPIMWSQVRKNYRASELHRVMQGPDLRL